MFWGLNVLVWDFGGLVVCWTGFWWEIGFWLVCCLGDGGQALKITTNSLTVIWDDGCKWHVVKV